MAAEEAEPRSNGVNIQGVITVVSVSLV